MKLSINLATLAISTLVSAYCVQPALQPTISEKQEVLTNAKHIPGQNILAYCNDNPAEHIIQLKTVNIVPFVPVIGENVQVYIFGFTYIPIHEGIFIRVFDWKTREDLITPAKLFSVMRNFGGQLPLMGNFDENFQFTSQISRLLNHEIGIELYYPDGLKLLCVKTPVRFM
ncbi:CSEP0041 putative effector protein [Blumeria hordei DH14]|uniref:CSEP0041 putative effector protein n=1 Tax=Blumeria graminis f. sp. hordei (strain DH14) TaxID=546991 RepID=N1JH01_BLUG1|nr:CSEP0041 putative effector protein [Blumeria hordei DH14]